MSQQSSFSLPLELSDDHLQSVAIEDEQAIHAEDNHSEATFGIHSTNCLIMPGSASNHSRFSSATLVDHYLPTAGDCEHGISFITQQVVEAETSLPTLPADGPLPVELEASCNVNAGQQQEIQRLGKSSKARRRERLREMECTVCSLGIESIVSFMGSAKEITATGKHGSKSNSVAAYIGTPMPGKGDHVVKPGHSRCVIF